MSNTTWTFRAECEADVGRLRENTTLEVLSLTQPKATEGDVHVTVATDSIEELVEAMTRTPDLHIAIGTLKPSADFDGVQDGPFLSRAYGGL
jgi:hypothetical protein